MLNLKELLIKTVKNYKIGDIASKDADRLRKGMIEFIKHNSIETVDDIFNAQTSFEINKYEQQEPLFVSFIDSIYNIVNLEDDNYKTELIVDLTFFIEKVLETIEEATDE